MSTRGLPGPNPRIFISAVSKELQSARNLVADTVAFLGFDAEKQGIFGTESGNLLSMLQGKIDGCQGVIHLIGGAYGYGPHEERTPLGSASYTQYEALYAESCGIPVHYILLPDEFPRDHALMECEPPEPPGESRAQFVAKRRGWQQRYRESIKTKGAVRYSPGTLDGLRATILEMRRPLDKLHEAWRWEHRAAGKARRFLVPAVAVLLLLIVWLVWRQREDEHKAENVAQQGEAAAGGQRETNEKLAALMQNQEKLDARIVELTTALTAATRRGEVPGQARDAVAEKWPLYIIRNPIPNFADAEIAAAEKLGIPLSELRNRLVQAEDNAVERVRLSGELYTLTVPRPGITPEDEKLLAGIHETARRQRVTALEDLGESERIAIHFKEADRLLRDAESLTSRERDEKEWVSIQLPLVRVDYDLGRYQDMEKHIRAILPYFERTEGAESKKVLGIRSNLAVALAKQSQFAKAEVELKALLVIQQRIFGAEHEATLAVKFQ